MTSVREDCREFRAVLLQALEGQPVPRELTLLSWHQHLLSCGECRSLLEHEEALEELLATLPDPKLPPDLVRRVSARLRAARERGRELDDLLELAEMSTPEGLGARVSAGVRAELALDRLLDLDQVEAPDGLAARVSAEVALDRLLEVERAIDVPAGLAASVLGAVDAERNQLFAPLQPWYLQVRTPYLWAAAAGFLLLVLSPWIRQDGTSIPDDGERVAVNAVDDSFDPESLPDGDLEVLLSDGCWNDTESGPQPRIPQDLSEYLADAYNPGDELLLAFQEREE